MSNESICFFVGVCTPTAPMRVHVLTIRRRFQAAMDGSLARGQRRMIYAMAGVHGRD